MKMTPGEIGKYYEEAPWFDVQANSAPLINAACRDGYEPLTMENLKKVANGLYYAGKIVLAQVWQDAWTNFLARRPEFSDVQANMFVCFDLTPEHTPPHPDDLAAAFCEVADRESQPLTINQQARQTQSDANERARLTQEKSQGRSTYSARDNYGRVVTYQTSELADETTDRLREIEGIVTEQRKLLASTPAEVRKVVQTQHAADRREAQAVPNLVLTNPETGVEYTRKELLHLMHTQDKDAFRKMLWNSNGDVIRGAKEALDRILGVKPREEVGHVSSFNI